MMTEQSGAVDILWWISFVLTIAGIVLIILTIIRGWRHPDEARGKKTLLFAMGIVPLGVVFFTDQALFHSMQEVEFCNSCHVMEPYVDVLQKSGEETLAAMHVQHGWIRENACYTCHTDYDMLGGAKAKIRGLRHLYAYYIKKSQKPPELYEPFPNGNCLACHSKTMTFMDIEEHSDNIDEIRSDDISCLDCHETAHPDYSAEELEYEYEDDD